MKLKAMITFLLSILLVFSCNACDGIVIEDDGTITINRKDEGASNITGENKETSIITSERRDQPTPNGGDYSEIFYLDDDGNSVDKNVATRAIIRECKVDGTLIHETFANINQSNATEEN